MLYTSFLKFRFLSSCQYINNILLILLFICRCVPMQLQLVSEQKLSRTRRASSWCTQTKVFKLWDHYSNGEISPSQLLKTRTLSGPKELSKTIIELSLTKDIYLTLIKDMYWSKWLLCSYSCFSWDSIWPLYLCLCSPCALFFFIDREVEVASSWMLHEEMF